MKNIAKHILVFTMMFLGSMGAWAQITPEQQSNGSWKFTMPNGNRLANVTLKADADLAWQLVGQPVPQEGVSGYVGFEDHVIFPTLSTPHGLTVTYSSTNTNAASIDANTGVITFVDAGTTTIKAAFAGDNDYAPDTVSYTLTVVAPYTLTLVVNEASMGSIALVDTPAYVLPTPTTGIFKVIPDSTITIKATPAAHHHLNSWSNISGTDLEQTFTMTKDSSITANFAIDQFTINATVAEGQGSMGSVIGGNTYDYGTPCTLIATPATGYHFVSWMENDTVVANAGAEYIFSVTGDRTLKANFAINTYTLTLRSNPAHGNAGHLELDSVNHALPAGVVASGDTIYKYIVNHGTPVTINAIPAAHYHLASWSNTGGNDLQQTFTMTKDSTIYGVFAIDTFTLTLKTNDINKGTVEVTNHSGNPAIVSHDPDANGTRTYKVNYGTEVIVKATPAAVHYLASWSNGVAVNNFTSDSQTLTITENTTLTANFAPYPTLTLDKTGEGTVTVEGAQRFIPLDTLTTDYIAQDGDILTGTLANNVKISIADSATVTLHNASINADGGWTSGDYGGITCLGDATIVLSGENTVKGFSDGHPGIKAAMRDGEGAEYTLTIHGDGSLNAFGNYGGAGIGSGKNGQCGNINITGGNITATGGGAAAGIGSGHIGRCGTISITGGTIIATGGNNAAGIGLGHLQSQCGTITISDGVTSVKATKGKNAVNSIGHSDNQNFFCDTVTIGGTVYWNGSAYVGNDSEAYLTQSPLTYYGNGTGSITGNGNNTPIATIIDLGNGQYSVYPGTEVTVKATPAEHNHLASWTPTHTLNAYDTAHVIVNTNTSLTANFAIDQFTLTLANDGNGTAAVKSPLPSTGVTDNHNGTYTVDYNTELQLAVFPAEHYHFAKWSDNNTDTPRTVTITKDSVFTATFAINQYTVTAAVANGQSTLGSASGTNTVDYGSNVTLTAAYNPGYHFVKWTEADTTYSTNASIMVQATGNRTLTANFAANPVLTLDKTGEGTVTIPTPLPEGVIANTDGTYSVYPGTEVTVKATPAEHNRLASWTPTHTLNEQDTAHVIVNETMTLTANFVLSSYDVTASVANTADVRGTVQIAYTDVDGQSQTTAAGATAQATAQHGSTSTLTATPATGYHFVKWTNTNSDSLSTSNPLAVTSDVDTVLIAVFDTNSYTITYIDGETEANVDTFKYRQPVTDYTLSREGWNFDGWNPAVPALMPAESLTVYAQWTRICDSVTDYDNNLYASVNINNLCWMASNLRTTHFSDGRDIANLYEYTSYLYPSTVENVVIYGRLYDWYDAVDAGRQTRAINVQGICPAGWRLPTEEDFAILDTMFLPNLRSTNYWVVNNGNNSTGLDLRPSGMYDSDAAKYQDLLCNAYLWSATATSASEAHCRMATYYCDTLINLVCNKGNAYSVRCVKD